MSNYKIIINPNEINYNEWSDFVFNHPYGNAFQTPEMYEAYKMTPLYEPIFIAVKNNQKILGILLAVVQKEYSLPFGFISSRSIVWGGPLIIDNNLKILDLILKEYDKIVSKKAIYSQFRNFWEQDNNIKSIFKKYDLYYQEHLNIIIDLNKNENELWNNIDSKGRNKIRKAIQENVTCTIKNDYDVLIKSYRILKETYKKAKLPLPKFSLFKNLLKYNNHKFNLFNFVALWNNNIIGCRIILGFKNILYDFYAGSYVSYLSKHPNDILPWEIFKWGKANGYTIFDFGGAGKPGVPYGVRDYKNKFGGKMVEYGRYEKIHHPLLMKIATTGFKIWQKIKF